jgi:Cd2+/Zn2+-exporting ATPase
MMFVLVVGAAFFELPLPLAVLGHEGGTVLVVLNGLRLLNDPIRNTRSALADQKQVKEHSTHETVVTRDQSGNGSINS